MEKCGIYKITCVENNKVYIGSSSKIYGRWSAHKSRLKHEKNCNPNLLNSYKKYGLYSLKFEIIEECDQDNLINREEYWFEKYINDGFEMFNWGDFIDNPTRGVELSDEHKKKVSEGLKEYYKHNDVHNKGKKIKEETRNKISNTIKKMYENGKLKKSDDNKRKLIEKAKLPKSKEHIQKLKETKIKTQGKKVRCIDTNESFDSLSLAAEHFDVYYQAIRQSIINNGKCKGLKFEYI